MCALPKGLLLVTMRDARSYLLGDEMEEQVGSFGLEGDLADLVDDQQRDTPQPGELVLEAADVVGVGEPGDPRCRAAQMRPSPPWDSRAATSRCRHAARNSSCVHDSARARSASRSTAPASDGAFSARAR